MAKKKKGNGEGSVIRQKTDSEVRLLSATAMTENRYAEA